MADFKQFSESWRANGGAVPFVLADGDGRIIYANDAAHETCAALICGADVYTLFPTLYVECCAARAAGQRVIRLRFPGEAVDCLTVELRGSVMRIYPNASSVPAGIIYEEAAREFAAVYRDPESEARTRELYDTLISANTATLRSRAPSEHLFSELLSGFFESALPRLRSLGHRLVLRTDDTVTDTATVCTDIYSFHLMLSAAASAVGYAADGDLTLSAHHTGADAVLTVSAKRRRGLPDAEETFFGPHTADIMFAESLAYAAGCELSKEITAASVSVTLTAPASGYYPEWLKDRAADTAFNIISASGAASIICI